MPPPLDTHLPEACRRGGILFGITADIPPLPLLPENHAGLFGFSPHFIPSTLIFPATGCVCNLYTPWAKHDWGEN